MPGYLEIHNPFASPEEFATPRARPGKATHEPCLPPGAEWLLLTTAPPTTTVAPIAPPLSRTKSIDTLASTASVGLYTKLRKFSTFKGAHLRRPSVAEVVPAPGTSTLSSGDAEPSTRRVGPVFQTSTAENLYALPRQKLNSRSHTSYLPHTMEKYSDLYANGEIDIEDPPLPPSLSSSSSGSPASLTEDQSYAAPRSHREASRQRLIGRLDLLGLQSVALPALTATALARSRSEGSEAPSLESPRSSAMFSNASSSSLATPPSSPARRRSSVPLTSVPSIQGLPALQAILSRCQELFSTKVAIISILSATHQCFLASCGMPDGVDSLPRKTTLCGHTILNGSTGLCVLDTQKDWRFQSNMLSVVMGTRFYAGMPIFVANAAKDAGLDSLAIGTLAIIDNKPRKCFTESDRAQLRSLAADAASEIEMWIQERQDLLAREAKSQGRPSSTYFPGSSAPIVPARTCSLQTGGQAAMEKPASTRYQEWCASLPNPTPAPPSLPASNPGKQLPFVASPTFLASGLPFGHRPARPVEASKASSFEPVAPPPSLNPASTAPILCYPSTNFEEEAANAAPLTSQEQAERRMSESSTAVPLPPLMEEQSSEESHGSQEKPAVATRRRKTTPPPPARGKKSELRNVTKLDIERGEASQFAMTDAAAKRLSHDSMKHLLDTAVLTLGRGLSLSLAYLLVVDYRSSDVAPHLSLLASYNRASSLPSFSPSLHLKALTAPEGGLLYKNPDAASLPLACDLDDDVASAGDSDSFAYASGILIPVANLRGRGIVLGGYTINPQRSFTGAELGVFNTVALQVGRFFD